MYALSRHSITGACSFIIAVSESKDRLIQYISKNKWFVSPYCDNAFYPFDTAKYPDVTPEYWCEIERVKTL